MTGYYLKWTRKGRVPSYQGGAALPPPGEWSRKVDNPVLCVRGWHACRYEDVLDHVSDELWVCELDGPIVEGNNKVAGTRIRLVEQVEVDLLGWMWDCLGHEWEPWVPKKAHDAWRTMLTVRTAYAARAVRTADAATYATYADYAAVDAAAYAARAVRTADAAAYATYAADYAARAVRTADAAAYAAARRWQLNQLLTVYCNPGLKRIDP